MKNSKKKYNYILRIIFNIIFSFVVFKISYANDISIEIDGNTFTDDAVILSLIKKEPDNLSEEYSNYIIKSLDSSQLFEKVSVKISNNKYIISIIEYPNINKLYFENNERLKDDELQLFADELNLINLNPININKYILEVQKLYQTFGYSNVEISYTEKYFNENNTVDIYFNINEGKITKINKIFFEGNTIIDNQTLRSVIGSKTKTLRNFFANNNFKQYVVTNDVRLITNYYKNNGYIDVRVDYKIEYLKNTNVNVYFNINEGDIYSFSSIKFIDENDFLDNLLKEKLIKQINDVNLINDYFSIDKINDLKDKLSNTIIADGIEFFEINTLEKIEDKNIDILFAIYSVKPKYANQINIYGNTRTYDYVIRRELELIEGDAVYENQIDRLVKKLRSLNLFESVEILQSDVDENLVNVDINVKERQTGTVNAGVSVGTLEGVGLVAGLKERNFYGTGRSLEALVNSREDSTEFTFQTTDRLNYENDFDISYGAEYREEDFTKASSYKLNTLQLGLGIGYDINPKLRHNVDFDYVIKDYSVTNSATVATAIRNSSGESVSFLLGNSVIYNTLNSSFLPKDGRLLSFSNIIETPTSSSNGYIRNSILFKNYKKINKNILSLQTRLGNITSLSNNDILTDNKFSLGGRWLRGFDTSGAGPRNSRTSYVGGNNLFVTKLDYSREVTNNSDFPILLNIFNDYGLLWENKTTPTHNDNSLRISAGFGIKYYSPIGPIGFSWGFPLMDEEYDINRMFLFSVGNLD